MISDMATDYNDPELSVHLETKEHRVRHRNKKFGHREIIVKPFTTQTPMKFEVTQEIFTDQPEAHTLGDSIYMTQDTKEVLIRSIPLAIVMTGILLGCVFLCFFKHRRVVSSIEQGIDEHDEDFYGIDEHPCVIFCGPRVVESCCLPDDSYQRHRAEWSTKNGDTGPYDEIPQNFYDLLEATASEAQYDDIPFNSDDTYEEALIKCYNYYDKMRRYPAESYHLFSQPIHTLLSNLPPYSKNELANKGIRLPNYKMRKSHSVEFLLT